MYKVFLLFTVIVSVLGAGAMAEAKTFEELSQSVLIFKKVTDTFVQDDTHMRAEQERETGSELFPAMEGMTPVLTLAQKNLLRRCDVMKVQTRRCTVLRCRLLAEGCKR